jgi:hypothetical protein
MQKAVYGKRNAESKKRKPNFQPRVPNPESLTAAPVSRARLRRFFSLGYNKLRFSIFVPPPRAEPPLCSNAFAR